jgi:hypothetical protein
MHINHSPVPAALASGVCLAFSQGSAPGVKVLKEKGIQKANYQRRWLMPVILAIQEAAIRKIEVRSEPTPGQ